jgi:hypothetical protein
MAIAYGHWRLEQTQAACPATIDLGHNHFTLWAMELFDFDRQACLSFDPLEGDFGEPGDREIKNYLTVSRKGGPCDWCAATIISGAPIRRRVMHLDGEMRTFRYCIDCCRAMARSNSDDYDEAERGCDEIEDRCDQHKPLPSRDPHEAISLPSE